MSRPVIATADQLREAFLQFFAGKGHSRVDSASLIPHDPTVLFTVAGMVPFKPYFLGDEKPPFSRAVSVQKCARAGGKHNDLDDVGRTKRHLVFFEMMGNFSFGDYFKRDAIPWSWELVTEVFGFDGDRLWITVHESDDEAEQIWHEQVGVPISRIQRLGDADNFWQMGETGPCGPCSEIHIDRGPAFGPEGGPLHDPQGDRFLEFWNLVFMQFNQTKDGSRSALPRPSIDTGAGLERILALMQGTDSIWETDVLFPLVEQAASLTGKSYRTGDYDDRDSFSLRVLAEHARSSTMLVSDGVFPSNENRGYVLRRIIRRAVRHAYLLGTESQVMAALAGVAIDVMGNAYPALHKNKDFILGVLDREEDRFRHTLRTGLGILDEEMAKGGATLAGSSAFLLHDTYGFPLELTQEITGERGVAVDSEGFDREMAAQRGRAKSARRQVSGDEEAEGLYRDLVAEHGVTTFVGYDTTESTARVLLSTKRPDGKWEVFLDVTPFYAESGGQVGDTGTIVGASGHARVQDTTFAMPGLRRHVCEMLSGAFEVGEEVVARIDVDARNATRRNHTATHVLHHALREVLGEHVKQAGSLVAPDRLRFDFSHYAPLTREEIEQIEQKANAEVLRNERTEAYETTKDEAVASGAIAFFGDKYGDIVRVLRAGSSFEFCGGTHVAATGDIGAIKIVAESSIGSNLRRIEAVTGTNTLNYFGTIQTALQDSSQILGVQPSEMAAAVQRKLDEIKGLQDEVRQLRSVQARSRSRELQAKAVRGVVVERVDGLEPGDLRELALAIREAADVRAVVLGGVSPAGGVALVAAVRQGLGAQAGDLIKEAAKKVGGGGGGKGDIAAAGGKDASALDAALDLARAAASRVMV